MKFARLYEKITTTGIKVYRGIRERRGKPFASDPGDFGRGVYWTTSIYRARAHSRNMITALIIFENPLILSDSGAYDLADEYNTVREPDLNIRIKNAERFTKDMLKMGYDGLVAVRSKRKGFHSELEIVDYRPYGGK